MDRVSRVHCLQQCRHTDAKPRVEHGRYNRLVQRHISFFLFVRNLWNELADQDHAPHRQSNGLGNADGLHGRLMTIFDQQTVSGTINTQALAYVEDAEYLLRTSATTTVTIATIAIPTNTTMAIIVALLGRQTASLAVVGERRAFSVQNNGGTLTVASSGLLATAQWTTSGGIAFLSIASSGTNALIQITPQTTNQTDWSALVFTHGG